MGVDRRIRVGVERRNGGSREGKKEKEKKEEEEEGTPASALASEK